MPAVRCSSGNANVIMRHAIQSAETATGAASSTFVRK